MSCCMFPNPTEVGKKLRRKQNTYTTVDKPQKYISRAPEFGSQIWGKRFWRDIKINQKWSLKKVT